MDTTIKISYLRQSPVSSMDSCLFRMRIQTRLCSDPKGCQLSGRCRSHLKSCQLLYLCWSLQPYLELLSIHLKAGLNHPLYTLVLQMLPASSLFFFISSAWCFCVELHVFPLLQMSSYAFFIGFCGYSAFLTDCWNSLLTPHLI